MSQVGFDDDGKIDSLEAQIFCDGGILSNEVTSAMAMVALQSCYEAVGWKVAPGAVNTNKVSNTYCRAPGELNLVSKAFKMWLYIQCQF